MKQKSFEEWTFDELVDYSAGELLQDILAGTKFRTAAWRATELAVRWAAHQQKSKKKK